MKATHVLAGSAATFLAALISPARAQTTPSVNDGDQLGEIIVTAQRRSERLQDVPLAISALGGADLKDRAVSNLEQLTATVPNVNISQNRSAGVITIRGIGFAIATAGADPGVAVHQDGVYISRPPAALAGFYDIDRIEIARGPQGTLYGRNATGGAVNIVTRAPSADPSGYISVTGGNYGTINTEGALGGPLVDDKLLGRVSFQTQAHGGYGNNLNTGSPINDLSTQAIRGRLTYLPQSNLTIDLSADYFKEDDKNFTANFAGFDTPCPLAPASHCATSYGGLMQSARDPRDVNYTNDPIDRRVFYGTSVAVNWDLGDVALKSLSAYRHYNYTWEFDNDGTTLPWVNAGRYEDAETESQEFQAVGKAGNLEYVGGLFFFHENDFGNGFGVITAPFYNVGLTLQEGTQITEAYAAFGQLVYRFTDQLSLTAGLRESSEHKTLENETIGPASNALPRPTRAANFDKLTPMATLTYKITPTVLGYLTYQQGFKSGGFAIGAGTPAFKPEYVTNYEGGFKATWLDGKLLTDISVFKYDYTNLQVGFTQGTVTVVTNAAAATVKGVEAEITVKPMTGLTLSASLAYLDATFDSYTTVDPNRAALGPLDLTGNHLPYAPNETGYVSAQYEWAAWNGTINLRGENTYSARVFFDPFNTESDASKSYDYSNLYLAYETDGGKWRTELFTRNVEDKLIRNGGTVGSGLFGGPVYFNYLPPRTYGVKVTRNF